MDPSQWMANFRVAHENAKAGKLNEEQKKTYLSMREELARSLVNSQALSVPEGQNARRFFRVAQMYKLEIDRTYQTMTTEVSQAGFSCSMQSEIKVGQKVGFSITLKRETDPVSGEAKCVRSSKAGLWRLGFSIEMMNEANAERLESALFDAVLARFK